MRALIGFLAFVQTGIAAFAAGRTVSFDVRGADAREISTIRLVLAEAARIASLEDHSEMISDTKSIAWYGSRVVPISIAARSSVGAVQIRLGWSPPENSVVSGSATLKQFEEIDAFVEKELTKRFSERVLRKIDSAKRPNQAPEPTTLLVMPRACARVTPSRIVAHL